MAQLVNMLPDSQVEPSLPAHLDWMRRKNRSARTIRERRLTTLRLARHLGHPVAAVTLDELRAWHDGLITGASSVRGDPLKPQSIHNAIVHVVQYVTWLVAEGIRDDNPSLFLERPEHVRALNPTPMPDADITRALATAPQPLHVWIGLAAFCGLRCMEIAALDRAWIGSGPAPMLRVMGKGMKERFVPLPPSLRTELLEGPFEQVGPMFRRMDGKPGAPSAMRVSERINDHLHALGIALTAHKLRHRYGTELYKLTRDPFKVAAYMGHSSVDTTRGYVRVAGELTSELAVAMTRLAG